MKCKNHNTIEKGKKINLLSSTTNATNKEQKVVREITQKKEIETNR